MELLNQFKTYLQDKGASKSTVKNYSADIRQFIQWFENLFQAPFNPSSVNQLTFKNYRDYQIATLKTSQRSVERHISSLRKFFAFVKELGIPIYEEILAIEQKVASSNPMDLKNFREFLYNHNASALTIKNYLMDVRQFLSFAQNNAGKASENLLSQIDGELIEHFKSSLLTGGFSPVSVNRKLSSIRRYMEFLSKKTSIPYVPKKAGSFDREEFLDKYRGVIDQVAQVKEYSSFPPFRLFQKIGRGATFIFDRTLVIPTSYAISHAMEFFWNRKGKPLFDGQGHLMERVESVALNSKNLQFHKKLIFHVHTTRPNWYKEYKKARISPFLNLALFGSIIILGSFLFYGRFLIHNEKESVLGSEAPSQNRIIYFKAKLTDNNNNPISSPEDLRLGIYNDPRASGSALLWEDVVYNTQADSDGNITLAIGKGKSLPQSVFSSSYQLYLGISVGTNGELSPRQELPVTKLAHDSETLAGLPVITAANAPSSNVVLALNSSGNLSIGGSNSPLFQATGGQFRLSGQSLLLESNPGSSGDIIVSPDGSGMLDIQKPIHNSTNNSNDPNAPGAVEVDDLLTILATSSGSSAFTVNQNSTGNLISGYNNGTAKFTVDSAGNSFIAGNVGIGTKVPLEALDVNGNMMLSNTSPTLYLGPRTYVGFDTVNLNIYSTTGDIVVHPATGSAFRPYYDNKYALGNSSYRWQSLSVGDGQSSFAGRIGVGITDPSATLQIQRNSNGNAALAIIEQGSGDLFTASSAAHSSPFVIKNDGSVGIGTANPAARLEIANSSSSTSSAIISNSNTAGRTDVLALKVGSAAPNSSNRFLTFLNGNGEIVGSVTGNGTQGVSYQTTGIDFAEYFPKYNPGEQFEAGEIVCLYNGKATKCGSQSSDILGIVSDKAGFVGGGQHQNDTNYVLVGLVGQLDASVSTKNGAIATNDNLSTSGLSGISEKANTAGKIVGKAMASFDGSTGSPCNDDPSYRCGTIPILVSVSWYDPGVSITDAGNLSIRSQTQDNSFALLDGTTMLNNMGAFGKAIIATLQTGFLQAQTITTDLLNSNKLISPIADIDVVHTNVISPLEPNSNISITLHDSKFVIHDSASATSSAVASIDNHGNVYAEGTITARSATFSGTIASNSLQTNNASISGTLHAGKLVADEIVGLSDLISKSSTGSAITTGTQLSSASLSGTLNSVNADFGQFNQGLIALGPTSLTLLSVSDQISVGGNMTLADNSINVLGQDLGIQSLRQGNVSFEGGLVAIDTDGNLAVGGNATFAKDVTIKGNLTAGFISPLPDSDLVVNLPASSNHTSQFVINNASGSAILAVDQKGNITAGGSLNASKLNLNLITPALAVSTIEVIATGSAGTAQILPHQTQLTVRNSSVTDKSLIYITPVGTPSGATPFLQQQAPGDSFTVGIEEPVFSDTYFNWLIIN